MAKQIWTVWAGGSQVDKDCLTLDEAKTVAEMWLSHGCPDVHIRNITLDRNREGK